MAIPKIKATYSLDPETVRLLERVSRRWGVSKSEALRRAIHAAASLPAEEDERLSTLDRLQETLALESTTAASWARRVRSERRAGRGGAPRRS